MNKPLKIRLTALSPIHIGCDDAYEPTNFRIENNKLIHFNIYDLIRSLESNKMNEFVKICSKGTIASLLEIYKFFKNIKIKGREIETAKELQAHYEDVLKLSVNDERRIKQELNNFSILRTAYSPNDNLPFIPGSSLKGSIRTAYLNKLAKEKNITDHNNSASKLETELLGGKFSDDPFRLVKISDLIPVRNVKTKIYYAVNKKKQNNQRSARGPYQILETITLGSVFEGFINFDESTLIKDKITRQSLVDAIKNFYASLLQEEMKIFKTIGLNSKAIETLQNANNEIVIKVGRHSGAEAVTIARYRKIKIRGPRGESKISQSATTLWLASESKNPNSNTDLLPFGWAKLEFIELSENELNFPEKIVVSPSVEKEESKTPEKQQVPEKSLIEASEETISVIADISYIPNKSEIVAEWDGKKSSPKKLNDKSFIPEQYHKKLFDKKEKIKAKVTIKKVGNLSEIIKVEPA
jgi:CRISPR-associated protein Csm5